MTWEVRQADCVAAMREMDEASVDAVVCDPPYGLGFMGRDWDTLGAEASRPPSAESPAAGTAEERGAYPRTGKGPTAVAFDSHQMQEWHQAWATEALRVLKPGGHLLAFGGTRTYHRLACAVEDAGFEIRDSLIWLYGSGFPKSLDVSKAIDKAAGAEREVVGENPNGVGGKSIAYDAGNDTPRQSSEFEPTYNLTAPATPEAQRWQGWGTALKPAHEPMVVARKPLTGTVAETVTKFGTGALNIDGCRIGYANNDDREGAEWGTKGGAEGWGLKPGAEVKPTNASGRWPANVALSHLPECEPVGERRVRGSDRPNRGGEDHDSPGGFLGDKQIMHSDARHADADGLETVTAWRCAEGCAVAELDRQSGEQNSGRHGEAPGGFGAANLYGAGNRGLDVSGGYTDRGGSSRFFYTAKSSRAERNAGLGGFEERPVRPQGAKFGEQTMWNGENGDPEWRAKNPNNPAKNHHPTVKPIALMRWLCRLVTPPGGTCLDPFLGSGTTGAACVLEGFDFIGIEREAEYAEISRARIEWWAEHQGKEADEVLAVTAKSERERTVHADAGQMGLFGDVSPPQREEGRTIYDGGAHRTVPRCPDHDTSILWGGSTYRCGCRIQHEKGGRKQSEEVA